MALKKLNLASIKKIHFTGIKGVGMAALACIAKDFGLDTSGSDLPQKFVADEVLDKKGIAVQIGFSAEFIEKTRPDLVVFGPAHGGEKNLQVKKAKALGVSVLTFGEALGKFFNTKKDGISVCGVGGKTTASAMLATIFSSANLNPSYLIGAGRIPSLEFSGKFDLKGDIFVSEADEYACSLENRRPKFYYQNPKVILITNLAYDHPDIYKNPDETIKVFKKFIDKLPQDGALVINIRSKLAKRLFFKIKTKARVITYEKALKAYPLPVPGEINRLNAKGAMLVSKFLGLDDKKIKQGLLKFKGISRRFEKIARIGSNFLYDDYAHHPEEIKATLKTARETFKGKKIAVVFQAHTYSRTKALLAEFGKSFGNADLVIITDIFPSAREKKDRQISGQKLANEIKKHSGNVYYLAGKAEVLEFFKRQKLHDFAIFTMGAGDVYLWHEDLMNVI